MKGVFNSLDISFIHGHIHGWSHKKECLLQNRKDEFKKEFKWFIYTLDTKRNNNVVQSVSGRCA